MPKDLAILVPTYNRYTYTRYTLDALAQYTDFSCVKEVLVGDAGSTDGTRELAMQYDFVTRTYDVPHGNVAMNIRRGVELAQSQYILMLCNDIIVSPDWNSRALEALKFGFEHGIWIVNYDMPDLHLAQAIMTRLEWKAGIPSINKNSAPWDCVHSNDFSLQRTYHAGGLLISNRELLLSKATYGSLGEVYTGQYYGMWHWHVLNFQGHIAVMLPRSGCLLLEFLPDIPEDSDYMTYRLEDPLVQKFLAEEDPVALRQEYIDKGWMRVPEAI